MRLLGLDLGTKTLGIAVSDKTQTIASPLKTITYKSNYETLFPLIKQIIIDENIKKIILGFPKNMNNTLGSRAQETIEFQKKLEKYLNIEVILQDERRSSIEAESYLLEANLSRLKRKQKIDVVSAVIILQTYLNKKKGRKNERY